MVGLYPSLQIFYWIRNRKLDFTCQVKGGDAHGKHRLLFCNPDKPDRHLCIDCKIGVCKNILPYVLRL